MKNFFKNFFKKGKGTELTEAFIEEIVGDMVEIPAGSFLMGSNEGEDDERPIHNVLIDRFYLSKYVVTQKDWYHVMGTKPWERLKFVKEGDRYPAVNVSWYDVRTYIDELNKVGKKKFRLPTEAEWEYACRAGASSAFAHGVLKFNLPKLAWYYENAFKKGEMYAHEVGALKPNKWGLFDIQGNVYEWCSDWYRRNYYNKSPISNPPGAFYGKYKSVRGGDWARTDYFLRIASRRHYSPHHKDSNIGFRPAMNAPEEKNVSTG
jgi:formylglycine-generating enzyme required for sulfatase activity